MRPLLFIGFLLQLVTATPWSRGDYGKLSFTADCSSYSFDFGRETLHANATSPENCTQTSGSDTHGTYDGAFPFVTGVTPIAQLIPS